MSEIDFQRIDSVLDRLTKAIGWMKTVGGVLLGAITLLISVGFRAGQFMDRMEAIEQTNLRQDRAIDESRADNRRILNDLTRIKARLGIDR